MVTTVGAKRALNRYLKAPAAVTVITLLGVLGLLLCLFMGFAKLGHDDRADAEAFWPGDSAPDSYAWVDVVGVSDWICGYDDGETYYAAEDADGGLYILSIKDREYRAMSDYVDYWYRYEGEGNRKAPAPYRLYGIVTKTNGEVRSSFEESFELSSSELYAYFGDSYLNTTSSPGRESGGAWLTGAGILALFTLIFAVANGAAKRRGKRSVDALEETGLLQSAANELDAPTNLVIGKGRSACVFSRNFIFSRNANVVLPYRDILWCYKRQQRTNFIPTACMLMANTADQRSYVLLTAPGRDKSGLLDQAMEQIAAQNGDAMIGFSPENRSAYKELCRDRQGRRVQA